MLAVMGCCMSAMKTGLARRLRDLPYGSGYTDFGCEVNRKTVDEVFEMYQDCGFLYEAKRSRLEPYWDLITENWRRSMSAPAGRFLHDVVSYESALTGARASVTYWATTNRAVHSQHLVSIGGPEGSRAVLLSCQSESSMYGHRASQNWFRKENRFPARVFGSCEKTLGCDRSTVTPHVYAMMPRQEMAALTSSVQVKRAGDADAAGLAALATELCGSVTAAADEWDAGDIELRALDARYREVGLFRYRRVFIAHSATTSEPIGMAVAYRGPLGLNFSVLESRCEIWLRRGLAEQERIAVVAGLARAAASVYEDFEMPTIPIVCDAETADALVVLGAERAREYTRAVWLDSGYPAWYDHVNGFYVRLLAVEARASAQSATASAVASASVEAHH